MTIKVTNLTIDLPVYTAKARSLRRTLTAATVGGALMHGAGDLVTVRALDRVSFQLEDGDRLALIGGNGAGKSTLLKVLAGVYSPTEGRVEVQGRVSAALNTGFGVDGEVSGLENIYLLGYYRGLSRGEIERQVPQIVASADLGNFINLPVQTYSAGMLGRLTFAVATAFEPDVLLMDEWLLAGDAAFMHGALARTRDFAARARIMVLATHSMDIIRNACNRAAYLQGGKLVMVDDVETVIDVYAHDVNRAHLASLAQQQAAE